MNNQTGTATVNRTMGLTEWSMIVLLSVIWGGSFFFIGVTVRELPPLTIVLSRVAIAAIVLLLVLSIRGQKMPSSARLWGSFFIMGMLNNVIPFILIVWGQTHIESGMASILNATTPIFSVVLTHFLTKEEKMTHNRIIGVVIGWIGVTLLIGIGALSGFGIANLGQLAVLGASISYAFSAIYARRFKGLKPIIITTGMLCCSTIIMTPIALLIDQPWVLSPGPATIWSLVALAVVCTAMAYLIYFRVLASAGATNVLLVTFLVPISAVTLGSLFLNEQLGWIAFMGMGLISIGLIAIDGRLLKILK